MSGPTVLERLAEKLGSAYQVAEALGLDTSYTTRFKNQGFIPESYALDVDELRVTDAQGAITAYDVLREASAVKKARAAA